jgi:hypothetical protein
MHFPGSTTKEAYLSFLMEESLVYSQKIMVLYERQATFL